MVDEAVVEPAVARARVEADEGNAEAAQHLRRDVAAPGDLVVRLSLNSIQFHFFLLPRDLTQTTCEKPPVIHPYWRNPWKRPTPLLCGMPQTHNRSSPVPFAFASNGFPITQTSAYITEKRGWLPRFGGSHQWSGSAQVECGEHGGTLRLTFMVAVYEVQAAATGVVAASDQTAVACLPLLACCGVAWLNTNALSNDGGFVWGLRWE